MFHTKHMKYPAWAPMTSMWRNFMMQPRLVNSSIARLWDSARLAKAGRLPKPEQQSWGASPVYVRVAEEFMLAHAREAITLQDIAQAAGISIRTLQNGFRQHRNTPPMTALRNHRLLLVREELLKADPFRQNVTTIAMNCGFTHLSRFASLFKAQFGESPSDALKRPGKR